MNAAIVGEDQVTREIIKKLISIYAPHLTQLNEIPARGSQALNAVNVERYNKLALSIPVILGTVVKRIKLYNELIANVI